MVQTQCLGQMGLSTAMASQPSWWVKEGIKMLLCSNLKKGCTNFLIYKLIRLQRETLRQEWFYNIWDLKHFRKAALPTWHSHNDECRSYGTGAASVHLLHWSCHLSFPGLQTVAAQRAPAVPKTERKPKCQYQSELVFHNALFKDMNNCLFVTLLSKNSSSGYLW